MVYHPVMPTPPTVIQTLHGPLTIPADLIEDAQRRMKILDSMPKRKRSSAEAYAQLRRLRAARQSQTADGELKPDENAPRASGA